MNAVNFTCYLCVAADFRELLNGELSQTGQAKVRTSKKKPSLAKNEICIKLDVNLPAALFRRPDLAANITVPAERAPFQINPEMQSNIADAIRKSTGLEVSLTVAASESKS